MHKLMVFNHVSLDGYFVDAAGTMYWAKSERTDPEWDAFVTGNAKGDGTLVFGRVTYELMASYWPTPIADKHDPLVAKRMNEMSKVVFSRSLSSAPWKNTRLLKGDLATEVRKLKQENGNDMVILGSGTIISQLASEGLIDEFQVVVNPIVLGKGRTMFESVKDRLKLRLTKSQAFNNGNVVLWYEPAA